MMQQEMVAIKLRGNLVRYKEWYLFCSLDSKLLNLAG
jgi:hypothetical protein